MVMRAGDEERMKNPDGSWIEPSTEPGPIATVLVGIVMLVPALLIGICKGVTGMWFFSHLFERWRDR